MGERDAGARAARWRCRADTARAAAGRPLDGAYEDLHLPGLRPARRAAAPGRRAAAGVLRPRGAQRADRPPGAQAPREERGEPRMADEAYRAVFLRVHPTGKMVLSLTTERRRQRGPIRPARRRGARRTGARRQGRPRRREPLRLRPRLQHEPVATACRRRSRARPRRSAPRRSCSRARRSRRRGRAAVGGRRVRRQRRRADDRRPRALRPRLRRAAAGRRGRARRAGRLSMTSPGQRPPRDHGPATGVARRC